MKKKLLTMASVCLILALATLPLSCREVEPGPTPEPGPGPTPGPGPVTPTPPVVEPQYGGVLKVTGGGLTPVLGYPPSISGNDLFRLATTAVETLIRFGEGGVLVPWLATAWEEDAEAKAITLTLRQGVKFHDGTDFNAEVAKWNMDNYRLSPRPELNAVESIDVIDDYTVRLNLFEWDSLVLPGLGTYAGMMVSKDAYYKHGGDELETETETKGELWCEKNPVGTGPFKLVSYEMDVGAQFERFDSYWQEGKPYLDSIEHIIIADSMVANAAFQRGEVDVIVELEPKDAKDLEARGKYNISGCPAGILILLGDGKNPGSVYTDIRVRQAVDHAIDRQAICDILYYGYAEATNQWAAPGDWAYNPDVVGYPYNPAKARELLAEAGYSEGLKTTILTSVEPMADVRATAIQGFLGEVGIDAELEIFERGKFYAYMAQGWEDALWPLVSSIFVPDQLWTMNRYCTPGSVLFVSKYVAPEFQEVLADAVAASDFETKQALTWELQRLLIDKYCMWSCLLAEIVPIAEYPEVHDTGLYRIIKAQWTPADAWLER